MLALLVRSKVRPPVVAEGEAHAVSAWQSIMHSYANVELVIKLSMSAYPSCLQLHRKHHIGLALLGGVVS